nr:transient receptor potential cation channel [Hymenolepis microstoma]
MDVLLNSKVKRIQTNEDVTSVHICAAMGDYIALRKLAMAEFSLTQQDKLGRTALHYAVQTNLPMVVMLLSREPAVLHIEDNFDKLPIDYCWNYSLQDIRDFLIAQSKAPSVKFVEDNDESDVEFESAEQEAQETNPSMALKFEAYLCTQVNPLYCYKGHTYCECCDDAYDHENFSGNAALDKLIASRKARFIKRPTNTFGQFETPCSSVMAEFVRLAVDTPVEDLEKLFFRTWKLRKPGLVLTLHGSVPLTKAYQKQCYNRIFGVFHKAFAWIITDGQYGSVSEVMSMGMPGYAEAYGLKRLQVIGIVPWRRLPFQANLRSSNYMGSTQVEFPPKGHKSELHTPLAPYHTRYLFVDSGSRNDIHCIQEFRTMFEVWLSKVTFQSDNCNLTHNTPVCGILVTGRPEDALGVCEALKNNIPFVIIAQSKGLPESRSDSPSFHFDLKDSGGLASIIEQYLSETKYVHEISQHYTDESYASIYSSQERLLEIMMHYWPDNDLNNDLITLLNTIISYSHLLQFFFGESNSYRSLDGKIVSALINPALFQDISKKHSWKPRLKLAMELNRTDFVLENILADSQWTLEEISPFARSCLMTNKLQFLRLLCDAGLKMYELADLGTIEDLFTAEAHRNTVGGRSLRHFFTYYNQRLPTTITVEFVDQTLKKMMGRKYLTAVTKCNNRRTRCIIRKVKESLSCQAEDIDDLSFPHEKGNYLQYLYLWALASKRYEIARFLLMTLTDVTVAALFGASFLRRKARTVRSPSDIEELQHYSLVFEDIALSILKQCYGNNVKSTMQLLIMERRTFNQVSCFVMAAEGNCKHFMEHQACQEYLDRIWAHTLILRTASWKFFFCIFIGIICPPVVPFVADFDESKYAQETSTTKRDVAYTILFILFAINLQVEFTFSDYGWMVVEICIIFMVTAHLIEYIKIALASNISWRNFISKRINQFTLGAFVSYGIGVTLQVILIDPTSRTFVSEQFSRVCLVFTASLPFQKLLQLLSVNRYIGPKLQMIRKMVVRDLLPFLVIVLIFWSMYTIFSSAILIRPSSSSDAYGAISRLFRIMRAGFFQMFGEFNLEDILEHYDKNSCSNLTTSGCTYPLFTIMFPILLSLFTLTTHVLLINLLIAIFTKTYDDMEAESQQLWTMQRYVLISSILSQPVLPATFSIFPLIFQCCRSGFRRLNPRIGEAARAAQRPFQKSFHNSPARARQLINWEKLNALIGTGAQEVDDDTEVKSRKDEISQRAVARTNYEKHWQILRHFRPTDQNKNGAKKSVLEKKIESIDSALEKIMNFIKNKPRGTLSRSPSRLVLSRQSLCSGNDGQEPPISFQWRNHQLAFYTSLNSDITPHTLDPPVPWDVPFPEYSPFLWRPSGALIPPWQLTVSEAFLVCPLEKMPTTSSRNLQGDPILQAPNLLAPSSPDSSSESSQFRNPEGRVGVAGKGLLPQFGGNPACIVVIEKEVEGDRREILVLKGARAQVQFPWFLCRHERDCNQISCFKELVRAFCEQLLIVSGKSEMKDSQTLMRFISGYIKNVSCFLAIAITCMHQPEMGQLVIKANKHLEE